ncbi:MAG TPA: hypothetical protein VF574_03225 [Allosphingosinicella sp.]|jgi:hypothetical protein
MSRDSSRLRALFEARIARPQPHAIRAMAAREWAMAAAERRMAAGMRAREIAIEAAERRLADALRKHERVADPLEIIRAIKGKRKPPSPGFRRRGLEGGEGVPVEPKPRPNPLAGAAAAPIE